MIKGIEAILIGSQDAKKLAEFYRNIVGFKQILETEMGEKKEKGFEFELGDGIGLYILDHSKVKGKNNLPDRIMFNLEVDDIEKEVKRLDKKGVKKIQDIYHVEDYGLIATFEDTDG